MTLRKAILALADGQIFEGISVGAEGECIGELVFNTAMTGYQEIISDPSYTNQIVTFTTAHVGNTGCNEQDMESSRACAAGVVLRQCTWVPSNYRSTISFPTWLEKNGVVGIAEIDTRLLTLKLRTQGAMNACISTQVEDPEALVKKAQDFAGVEGVDLALAVSTTEAYRWDKNREEWGKPLSDITTHEHHIVVYDFGVKHNILKILSDQGYKITVVPAQTSFKALLALEPDGVVLSNGPGDPKMCDYAITLTRQVLEKGIPLLGICLGFQILSLACGAKSIKMKFGHHGANHPVAGEREGTSRVFITSQNHGFTIDEHSLPDTLEVTHRSLFDGTLQGVRHRHKPALGFQGHPEASPGPHDIENIFDDFFKLLIYHQATQKTEGSLCDHPSKN